MEIKCFGKSIRMEDAFRRLGAFVGFVCVRITGRPGPEYVDAFLAEVRRIEASLKSRFKGPEDLKDEPVVRAYRSFYWRIGIDPTKVRPSGEALARRVLGGKGLRPIDPIVDAGNLASAETFVPIGLYDADKAPGDLVFALSKGGETFIPIGGDVERLQPGLPLLLSDSVVMHLYPHRDSTLTAVSPQTTKVVGFSAGVPGVERALVVGALERFLRYLSALGVKHDTILGPAALG